MVDLTLPETQGRWRHDRFLRRVLTPGEKSLVARADDPHATLWTLWAAKEAAFKASAKLHPTSAFRPAAYAVRFAQAATGQGVAQTLEGRVQHGTRLVDVRAFVGQGFVHCIAVSAGARFDGVAFATLEVMNRQRGSGGDPGFRLSEEEKRSVRFEESAQVRLLAKQLLSEHGYNDLEIIRDVTRVGFGPPYLRNMGHRLREVDLSLSHHGRFITACALMR